MDCSQTGLSVHGDSPGKNTGVGCHSILQGIFPTQDWTQFSHIADGFFTIWATREIYVVVQSIGCVWLCDPMDCSMPAFPVLHHILELAQTHANWVGDAIEPSHPLLSPLLLSSIFSRIRVFSNVLAVHIRWPKYWSFSFSISPSNEYSRSISFRVETGLILLSKGLWRVFSNTTVLRHLFFSVQPSLWSNSHIHTWLLEKP